MTVAQAGWYVSGFYPEGFLKSYAERIREFQLPNDTKIRDLSKGMRAKVALSLAMAFDPELLILDEPTSGLDPLVRRAFLESMIDRAAAGQTVFLSSHQIAEVERVADWVAILHQGQLQIVAPLEELKSSVTILDLSLRDPLLALPDEMEAMQMLHKTQTGRTLHLMVRGFTPAIETALSQHSNLFEIKSIRPNLEELYLGFLLMTIAFRWRWGIGQQSTFAFWRSSNSIQLPIHINFQYAAGKAPSEWWMHLRHSMSNSFWLRMMVLLGMLGMLVLNSSIYVFPRELDGLVLLLAMGLLGITALEADQTQNRFRFLADRGVNPWKLTICRIAHVSILASVACVAFALGASACRAYQLQRIARLQM